MVMKTSEKGVKLIKSYEGFRANSYVDPVGIWTLGYGTTAGIKKGMVVTEAQATQMLQSDLTKFENTINKLVKVPLTQNQFDAIASFVYNVGPGNFQSSTLLRLLNQKRYDLVPDQFLRWNKAGGKVLNGLTRRRKSEATLFKTGKLDV